LHVVEQQVHFVLLPTKITRVRGKMAGVARIQRLQVRPGDLLYLHDEHDSRILSAGFHYRYRGDERQPLWFRREGFRVYLADNAVAVDLGSQVARDWFVRASYLHVGTEQIRRLGRPFFFSRLITGIAGVARAAAVSLFHAQKPCIMEQALWHNGSGNSAES